MVLEGHQAEVYTCKFDPSGKSLASAGFDKKICTYITITSIVTRFAVLCRSARAVRQCPYLTHVPT
jgi:WD40 repeat protein